MRRRDFIAYGSAATLAAAFVKTQTEQMAEAQPAAITIELHMEEIYEEMIDGEVLFSLAFRDPITRLIRPPLFVTEGQTVTVKLVNKTRKPRRLAITGFNAEKFSAVQAGRSKLFTFVAPEAGSYVYHENAEGASGRVTGLYGALVVMPIDGRTPAGTRTPYSNPTPAQCALFDALGNSPRFPGEPWRPELPERNLIWMFASMDPAINQLQERNLPVPWATYVSTYRPRYFTLNGLSGFDSSHDDTCCPAGYEGEPHLLRTMNAGVCTHAPHIHGNHVFCLSESVPSTGKQYKSQNIIEVDTWMMKPLWRKDVMLPFIKPDEIPALAWPPKGEPWPLYYPMHCHIEMSQTAGGGSYPQGLVTHWEMLGPRRGA